MTEAETIDRILNGKFVVGVPAIPTQYHLIARMALRTSIINSVEYKKRNAERELAIRMKYPKSVDDIEIRVNGNLCPELREALLEITTLGMEQEIRELPQTPIAEFRPFAMFLKRYQIMSSNQIHLLVQDILKQHGIERSEKNIRIALDLKNLPTKEEISKKVFALYGIKLAD